MRTRFREAVDRAAGLLDDEGGVIADEVDLGTECSAQERAEERAKCSSLEEFGRLLHGVQDFSSHSNWSDEADPSRPVGDQNPPGLNRRGVSPVLDLRARMEPEVPEGDMQDGTNGTRRFRMRQKLVPIGDDYWIEDEDGRKVYKIDDPALVLAVVAVVGHMAHDN